ncbi:helix-turn-helix domain-containing protein [Roseomonas sp. SSH11]|uniref:Helix-turn-helix domain-containing protein n=1 Tax=Pararoseomonas baculiformis TaxID=2820812 RepID=A0ABS4AL25_9PROT|nr:helix-turn-helix domain-containing protein [Pararoseomonas baculiformis]
MAKLRQVEVLLAQGKSAVEAVRRIGVTEQTYYRWRSEYGGAEAGRGEAAECAGSGERQASPGGGGPHPGKAGAEGSRLGKLVSAARRRGCVEHVTGKLGVSERFACRVLGQHRSVQRKVPRVADDEAALTENIISLARRYGRYGYRQITALLRAEGWSCNHMA